MNTISLTTPHGTVFSVARADRFFPRLLGLMGRRLTCGDGLLLTPCNQVHCFFMRSAIDVAHLSPEGQILALTLAMAPGAVGRAVRGARSVLELCAGDAQRLDLRVGDVLKGDGFYVKM